MNVKIFAVETVLGCELKCPECAVGGGFTTRQRGMMSFDDFRIIADKIKPFCEYLYLHIWGEPMLNKDIFKMIEYASTFTRTNISTNGNSINDIKASQLITSGVSTIIVSIDGVTQEVYEQYRIKGSVAIALDALRQLQHYNCRLDQPVQIIPQFIVMKHNEHEMDKFADVCSRLGLTPSFKAPYFRTNKYKATNGYRRQRYSNITTLRNAMSKCESIKNGTFNILLDGSVVACCHDYDKFTCFGNIYKESVMEIWHKASFKMFRHNIVNKNAPEFCLQRCMTYGLKSKSV